MVLVYHAPGIQDVAFFTKYGGISIPDRGICPLVCRHGGGLPLWIWLERLACHGSFLLHLIVARDTALSRTLHERASFRI